MCNRTDVVSTEMRLQTSLKHAGPSHFKNQQPDVQEYEQIPEDGGKADDEILLEVQWHGQGKGND